MSKTKTVNGKQFRWDYQKKVWVPSHGSSGFEALGGLKRTIGGLFNRKKLKSNTYNGSDDKSSNKKTSKKPIVKSVGTVDFNVATPEGKKAYNKALNASKTSGAKTDKDKDKSTTKVLHGENNRKEAEKRKNRTKPGSAGARMQSNLRSKGFSQDELDRLTNKQADFKKHRKAGTLDEFAKKYPNSQTAKRLRKNMTPGQRRKAAKQNKTTTGSSLKLDKKQKKQLKVEKKVEVKSSQLPADKVQMADGSIVDRASLYKKKK